MHSDLTVLSNVFTVIHIFVLVKLFLIITSKCIQPGTSLVMLTHTLSTIDTMCHNLNLQVSDPQTHASHFERAITDIPT